MTNANWYARPEGDPGYYAGTSRRLLTLGGNPKVDKGREATGTWNAVLHLAPYTTVPGVNVCAEAGAAGCYSACLWRAGRGGIAPLAKPGGVAYARYQRTFWYARDPEAFIARVRSEAVRFARRVRRAGYTPALRLNGTSDIPYERDHPELVRDLIAEGIVLYDYTKLSDRTPPEGYSLIWSYSGAPGYRERLPEAMARYGRATVVFRVRPGTKARAGAPLPDTFEGYPVVDGDEHDNWYLLPRDVVVGLRAKGREAWRRPSPLIIAP